MLARYKILRGKRPAGELVPSGIRQDTRKHTRHCLRPSAEIVSEYLARPSPEAWKIFAAAYLRILAARHEENSTPFDNLADLALENDVYLGCSCPTTNNPDVNHCHTVLGLRFMSEHYPRLEVELPGSGE